MRRISLLLLFFDLAVAKFSALDKPVEKQLTDYLFEGYNSNVRPALDPTASLSVNLKLHIEALTEVNDKDETITISGWIEMSWNDSYLCWDPASFGGIIDTVVPSENVWRPDVAFNSVVGERFFSAKDVPAIIDHSCIVYFAPGGQWTHNCDLQMTRFPFDTQECQFVIITWYSAAKKITLAASNFTYATTKENDSWKIIATRYEVKNDGAENPIQAIFTLTIRRKPFYYVLYVIIPLIALAFLNAMVFRQPPEAGEKISLAITLLLAFSIWLIMLTDLTPRSSDSIPMLAVIITILMGLSSLSAIITVNVVHIHHCDEKSPIPSWAEKILKLSKLRCRSKAHREENYHHSASTWQSVATAIDDLTFKVAIIINVLMMVLGFLCYVSL